MTILGVERGQREVGVEEFVHIRSLTPIRKHRDWVRDDTAYLCGLAVGGAAQRRSPTNYSNFVHEQNDYGRQRDPGGQRVASEEVQAHACPAEASSYQGATHIRRSDCGREARAKDVPKPEELT